VFRSDFPSLTARCGIEILNQENTEVATRETIRKTLLFNSGEHG
jgi:hypothetical protein